MISWLLKEQSAVSSLISASMSLYRWKSTRVFLEDFLLFWLWKNQNCQQRPHKAKKNQNFSWESWESSPEIISALIWHPAHISDPWVQGQADKAKACVGLKAEFWKYDPGLWGKNVDWCNHRTVFPEIQHQGSSATVWADWWFLGLFEFLSYRWWGELLSRMPILDIFCIRKTLGRCSHEYI